MDNTISRQAVIYALNRTKGIAMDNLDGQFLRAVNTMLNALINIVNELPSAQPEIIYCKNCKHHWTHKCMDSMPIEICDLEQTFYDAEHDFCSLAERRENG